MADSGPKPEIEDVLSSIRRLVSQDARDDYVPSPRRAEPEGAVETLVLTPSLLVPEAVEDEDADGYWTEEAETPEELAYPEDDLSLSDPDDVDIPAPLADPEPPVSETPETTQPPRKITAPQDWEPDFAENDTSLWPEPPLAAPPVETTNSLGDELTRLESTIARLEAEVSESEADFESETGDSFGAAGVPRFSHRSAEPTAPHYDAAPVIDPPAETDNAEADDGSTAEAGYDPDLQSAEWAASAQPDPEWPEPEDAEFEDLPAAMASSLQNAAPRRLSLGDADAAQQTGPDRPSSYETLREEISVEETLSDTAEADEDDSAQIDATANVDLDDAALEAMVARLVRQELQGALGARITSRIRKMIRREIHRALTTRDFE